MYLEAGRVDVTPEPKGVSDSAVLDEISGPQLQDVIKTVPFPPGFPHLQTRTLLEEAADQTASLRRIASVSENMADWGGINSRKSQYIQEMIYQELYSLCSWYRATALIQSVAVIILGIMLVVR